jgi:2-octaprenyl-6-methoxyphenol hydroxylase
MAEPLPPRPDLVIAGGGFTGLALGLAVRQAGLEPLVVEAGSFDVLHNPAFDGRVSAIAPDVRRFLSVLGVWSRIEAAQPVRAIVAADGQAPSGLFLHFDPDLAQGEPWFHMVENRHLRRALAQAARDAGLAVVEGAKVRTATPGPGFSAVTLDDDRTCETPLTVAAEGRFSPLREAAGLSCVQWDYGQWGLVATVAHERPHGETAQERFLPEGVFAILPMTGSRSSIVWAMPEAAARQLLEAPLERFVSELKLRFTDFLGELSLEGPRWGYPLTASVARRFAAPRLALAGDAAHVVHPLAGQGLNLGLRDAAALAECVTDAVRLGLDHGGPQVLERYERWRRFDTVAMSVLTDGLNALFSNDNSLLRGLRSAGLAAVNTLTPVRQILGRNARGAAPDDDAAPRLLRGLAV